MYRFESLLNAGAIVAAMSDGGDGDCGWDGAGAGGRDTFLREAGVRPESLYALRQVHGCQIRCVDGKQRGQGAQSAGKALGDGDGLITMTAGIALGVTVADCVPVLLFDPVSRAIGAFHAGREGTTAGIALAGLERMISEFSVNPADLRAVIGPSIGPCCYEVSEEVCQRCARQGVIAEGRHIDLWASNREQLLRGGIKTAHIEMSAHCTCCATGFFSYRRQATKCRNLAVIMA